MNPLFYLSGVADEYNKAKKYRNFQQRVGILNMFTMFMIISILLGFFVFKKCFTDFGSPLIGIGAGLCYAFIIGSMDNGLFSMGKAGVFARAIIILLMSFLAGNIAGIAFDSQAIKEKINRESKERNPDFMEHKIEIEMSHIGDIEKLNKQELEDIRKNPENKKDIKNQYKEMKVDLEKAKDKKMELMKEHINYIEPNFSVGKIRVVHSNLPENERSNGWYLLFFIIELFPLAWKVAHMIFFKDTDALFDHSNEAINGVGIV